MYVARLAEQQHAARPDADNKKSFCFLPDPEQAVIVMRRTVHVSDPRTSKACFLLLASSSCFLPVLLAFFLLQKSSHRHHLSLHGGL